MHSPNPDQFPTSHGGEAGEEICPDFLLHKHRGHHPKGQNAIYGAVVPFHLFLSFLISVGFVLNLFACILDDFLLLLFSSFL